MSLCSACVTSVVSFFGRATTTTPEVKGECFQYVENGKSKKDHKKTRLLEIIQVLWTPFSQKCGSESPFKCEYGKVSKGVERSSKCSLSRCSLSLDRFIQLRYDDVLYFDVALMTQKYDRNISLWTTVGYATLPLPYLRVVPTSYVKTKLHFSRLCWPFTEQIISCRRAKALYSLHYSMHAARQHTKSSVHVNRIPTIKLLRHATCFVLSNSRGRHNTLLRKLIRKCSCLCPSCYSVTQAPTRDRPFFFPAASAALPLVVIVSSSSSWWREVANGRGSILAYFLGILCCVFPPCGISSTRHPFSPQVQAIYLYSIIRVLLYFTIVLKSRVNNSESNYWEALISHRILQWWRYRNCKAALP